ncbi:ataxin-10 isoform X3 [Heterodontus francisci]|uniref:ataxin-10 isoform X3 n=1 Tax=Heterodontus francisci TaxID=7792 RepID=UPI00355AF34B
MAASSESVPELIARFNELIQSSQKGDLVLVAMTPIQSLTIAFREQQNREDATQSVFESFVQILTRQLAEIEVCTDNPDSNRNGQLEACLRLTAECFRCLRNACIQSDKNQSHGRNVGLIDPTIQILQFLHRLRSFQSDTLLAAFRCGLQFLGNLVAGNEESKHIVWKNAFPDLFLFLIVTDQFFKCPDLVAAMYTKLNNQERVIVLDLLSAKLSEILGSPVGSDELTVPVRMMQFLAGCFLEKCKAVLKFTSTTDAEDEEALIVVRLLDILCETTSNHEKFSYLQNSPGLVEAVVELLYQTHLAGKQSRNVFSVSQSLSFTRHISHPAVGFKAHLIHLIGNLCYNNHENQDKVRELGGISLILDNCSIDDNNPFVSQWAVFAIRILTEQNMQNQEVISQMTRQGVADSAMLSNMGLQIEERDGKLYVKSQEKS